MPEDRSPDDDEGGSQRARRTRPFFVQKPTSAYEKHPKRDYEVHREWARFFLEIAAFIALIFYVHWTKIQSVATEKAALAAKTSADVSVATVRAWIVLTTTEWQAMQINDIPADQKIPIPIIHFKNVGKTAAVNVVGYIEYKTTIDAPNSQPQFTGCPTRIMRKDAVIIGDSDSEIWALTDSISASDRKLIDDGKATPYLHGCITYHDLLDPKRLRVTKFTGFLQPNRLVAGRVVEEANWQVMTTKTK